MGVRTARTSPFSDLLGSAVREDVRKLAPSLAVMRPARGKISISLTLNGCEIDPVRAAVVRGLRGGSSLRAGASASKARRTRQRRFVPTRGCGRHVMSEHKGSTEQASETSCRCYGPAHNVL